MSVDKHIHSAPTEAEKWVIFDVALEAPPRG